MSIFTHHRYTTQQLQRAHERLRKQCPMSKGQAPIAIQFDDPHDTKEEKLPRVKRQYRRKNH